MRLRRAQHLTLNNPERTLRLARQFTAGKIQNPIQRESFRFQARKRLCADSLRFYRLPGDRGQWVETYGRDTYVDYEQPLII
ncbi:MAG: CRISPR-associated endonuclease Cas1 [Fimbriimonadales bacterium]|nr:CRISPR-associated endonuclease Cas1 [Fimbriimonadales bacterium]